MVDCQITDQIMVRQMYDNNFYLSDQSIKVSQNINQNKKIKNFMKLAKYAGHNKIIQHLSLTFMLLYYT